MFLTRHFLYLSVKSPMFPSNTNRSTSMFILEWSPPSFYWIVSKKMKYQFIVTCFKQYIVWEHCIPSHHVRSPALKKCFNAPLQCFMKTFRNLSVPTLDDFVRLVSVVHCWVKNDYPPLYKIPNVGRPCEVELDR